MLNIFAVRGREIGREVWGALGVLLITGALILNSCGRDGTDAPELEKLVSHDAIHIDGGILSESYLKISSTTDGQSAVAVTNGGQLTLRDATIMKIGDEAGGSPTSVGSGNVPGPGGLMPEGTMFENNNPGPGASHAGVYAGSGGIVALSNVSIETAIGEGQGLYASGAGSSITLVNGTITTDGRTAHGVFVAHRGAVNIENVTIITKGEHSSALATFRGNGTVTAVGGTYTAFGKYSAGIYSAGNIVATDVICKSVSDNAAVVEGGSRISLTDSVLWSREKGAVMIYQSFSGDALIGPSEFKMTGGSISAEEGPIFYVTNTTGRIVLENVELYSTTGVLLEALKGDWGVDLAWAKPTQGGTVTLHADNQALPGDIIVDEFSSVNATFQNGTKFTGAINAANTGKDVQLTLDASSSWDVTADSHLTGPTFAGGIPAAGITNIIANGHSVYYDKAGAVSLGGNAYDLPGGGKLLPE